MAEDISSKPSEQILERPKTVFLCCFPPMRNALQSSTRGRSGMDVRFSIPESDTGPGVRLYLMRDRSVTVGVRIVDIDAGDLNGNKAENEEDEDDYFQNQATFLAMVHKISSPGSRDGLEVTLWVPESELPAALPLHVMRGKALRVSIEVLEDELRFADIKTKRRIERENSQPESLPVEGDQPESRRRTAVRRARPGRIERGYPGLQ